MNAKLVDAEVSDTYDAKCVIMNTFLDIVKVNYPDINLEHFSKLYFNGQRCRVDYKGYPLCHFSYTRTLLRKEKRDTYGIRPKKLIYGFNHVDVKLASTTDDFKTVISMIDDTCSQLEREEKENKNLCFNIYDTIKQNYPNLGDKKLYQLLKHLVDNFKKIVGEQS